MTQSRGDARAELKALVVRGLDWATPERLMLDPAKLRRAAVLVLFGILDSVPAKSDVPIASDLDVLLQRRSPTMGHHPGQISFPGGGVDESDADIAATALREAVEETGLEPGGVEMLGPLPELGLPISNNLVTPVLAWWAETSEVAAVDHRESVEVFRIPVADLIEPDNRATLVFHRGGVDYLTPAFQVGGAFVWGFTALVLDRIFNALDWTVPWDRERTVELP